MHDWRRSAARWPGRRLCGAVLAVGFAALLSGCAAGGTDTADAGDNDPAESVNRVVFDANMAADKAVLKPIAEAYRDNLSEGVRQGIHNAAGNLNEPFVAANDVLQGNFSRAWTSARRFAVNTTVGIGGVVDRAKEMELPPHSTDIGQTLAVWGVGEGPQVQLPALGPSNARDAVGTVAGFVLNPLAVAGGARLTSLSYARGGADFVDTRASHLKTLEELERTSLDFYTTLRSVAQQRRQSDIEKAKRGGP